MAKRNYPKPRAPSEIPRLEILNSETSVRALRDLLEILLQCIQKHEAQMI